MNHRCKQMASAFFNSVLEVFDGHGECAPKGCRGARQRCFALDGKIVDAPAREIIAIVRKPSRGQIP